MTEESKAKSIKLGIKDRFMVRELLPRQGTLVDQILAGDIDEKIVFSQDELEAIGFTENQGMLRWNDKATLEKDIEFSRAELEFLDRQIKRMSGEGTVTRDMVQTILKVQGLMRVS